MLQLNFPFWMIVPQSAKLGDSCESPNHVSTFSTAARAIAHLEGKEAGQWDVRLVSRTSRAEVAEYLKRSGVHNVCHDANPDGTGGHTMSVDDLLADWTL